MSDKKSRWGRMDPGELAKLTGGGGAPEPTKDVASVQSAQEITPAVAPVEAKPRSLLELVRDRSTPEEKRRELLVQMAAQVMAAAEAKLGAGRNQAVAFADQMAARRGLPADRTAKFQADLAAVNERISVLAAQARDRLKEQVDSVARAKAEGEAAPKPLIEVPHVGKLKTDEDIARAKWINERPKKRPSVSITPEPGSPIVIAPVMHARTSEEADANAALKKELDVALAEHKAREEREKVQKAEQEARENKEKEDKVIGEIGRLLRFQYELIRAGAEQQGDTTLARMQLTQLETDVGKQMELAKGLALTAQEVARRVADGLKDLLPQIQQKTGLRRVVIAEARRWKAALATVGPDERFGVEVRQAVARELAPKKQAATPASETRSAPVEPSAADTHASPLVDVGMESETNDTDARAKVVDRLEQMIEDPLAVATRLQKIIDAGSPQEQQRLFAMQKQNADLMRGYLVAQAQGPEAMRQLLADTYEVDANTLTDGDIQRFGERYQSVLQMYKQALLRLNEKLRPPKKITRTKTSTTDISGISKPQTEETAPPKAA